MSPELAPDLIVTKDHEGKFLLCNKPAADCDGTTPDDMVGKHDGDCSVTLPGAGRRVPLRRRRRARLHRGECAHRRRAARAAADDHRPAHEDAHAPGCAGPGHGQTYLAELDADGEEARTLRPLQAAAITYRIAFGPRAGQKVLTLCGAMPRESAARQPLCADIDGFSLHAAVRVEANDRKLLEQLCRYITRPALSDERMQINAAGQVELKLKTPWRDGTAHLVMSPLEFMQRLAALVPRPRLHLIRFRGLLAPNAKLRPLVVPQGPEVQERTTEVAAASDCEVVTVQARPHRTSWARLLKRVFDIDMQHCPNCGSGELKLIAAILERPVIEKILTHLGLDPQPPPRGRACQAWQD